MDFNEFPQRMSFGQPALSPRPFRVVAGGRVHTVELVEPVTSHFVKCRDVVTRKIMAVPLHSVAVEDRDYVRGLGNGEPLQELFWEDGTPYDPDGTAPVKRGWPVGLRLLVLGTVLAAIAGIGWWLA